MVQAGSLPAGGAGRRGPLRHLHRHRLRSRARAGAGHRIRRRGEEEHLLGDELPAAAAGHPDHALLGQRRARRTTPPCSSACRAPARPRCRPIPNRALIGDDETGWGDEGVFNLEGGCYAKCINLSREVRAPDLGRHPLRLGDGERGHRSASPACPTSPTPATPRTRAPPTRCSSSRARACPASGPHPRNVIFLTADAFGVLPPVARLTPAQAMYHYISGLHRQGGRHRDRASPSPRPPSRPASAARSCPCTRCATPPCWASGCRATGPSAGWSTPAGAAAPTASGQRMKIEVSRAVVSAILSGELEQVPTVPDPVFGIEVPTSCPGRPRRACCSPAEPGPTPPPTTHAPARSPSCSGRTSPCTPRPARPEVRAAGPR